MFWMLLLIIVNSAYLGHDITSHNWVEAIIDFIFLIIWIIFISKQYKKDVTMKE